jgi:hypothetical protein
MVRVLAENDHAHIAQRRQLQRTQRLGGINASTSSQALLNKRR